jgi:predicted TIM-barrel fold metal-dependent hydrolase
VEYADVLDLAAFDRVYMKLSGLGHFSADGAGYASARPFTRRVAAEFGPARLVWGSGLPGIVDVQLPDWPEADRARIKGGNLAHLLRLDQHPE